MASELCRLQTNHFILTPVSHVTFTDLVRRLTLCHGTTGGSRTALRFVVVPTKQCEVAQAHHSGNTVAVTTIVRMARTGSGKTVTGAALGLANALITVITIVIVAVPIPVLILRSVLPRTANVHSPALPVVVEMIPTPLADTARNTNALVLFLPRRHRTVIQDDTGRIAANTNISINVVATV